MQMTNCRYLSPFPGSSYLEETEALMLLQTASKIFHIRVLGVAPFYSEASIIP